MKNAHLAGPLLIILSTGAFAQSSVTLYGVIDSNVRYLTNASSTGNSLVEMGTGGMSESEVGIRGVEDIGQGVSAIFRIENRFFSGSGQSDPALPFWNTAFVGLRSATLGQLTLGRQTNTLVDTVTKVYASNPWIPYSNSFQPELTMTAGIWTSNLAKYAIRLGSLTGEASYAFGGDAGHTSYGSQMAFGLGWLPGGPVSLAAAYSAIRDSTNGSLAKLWTAGGSYTWDATQFHAGYYENRLDPGFSSYLNGPFTQEELMALKYLDFSSRRMMTAGITQTVSTTWHFSLNYWRTWQSGKTTDLDGTASQFQLVADYSLSRRTDVYLEGDYSLYRGDLIGAQLQGANALGSAVKSTQLGLAAGVRHQF
ncbi:porin [Paraburkholderia sp. J12]|uniref:porin n=1 Tax=Paraburkholderia sp. J12 TaxID=2805432 RepID=UPI002ABE9EDF|nr:porin [Paraburkholderia sp. J12]